MRLKNPGGNLTWLTPLLVIGGAYMAVTYFHEGSPGFGAAYGLLAVLALLVWFDIRWVALPLIFYFVSPHHEGVRIEAGGSARMHRVCDLRVLGVEQAWTR
jgi:hypothetical protein